MTAGCEREGTDTGVGAGIGACERGFAGGGTEAGGGTCVDGDFGFEESDVGSSFFSSCRPM